MVVSATLRSPALLGFLLCTSFSTRMRNVGDGTNVQPPSIDRQAKLAVEKADLDAGKESEIGCREGQRLSVKFIAYRQTYRRRASRLGSSTPAPLGSALRATKNQTRALAEGSLSLGTFFGIPCSVRHVTHPTVCILNRLDLVKHCASE